MKPAERPQDPETPCLLLVEEPREHPQEMREVTGLARVCLLSLGALFSVIGAVGAFLPVLPTTPFMLVAAACFARSSPALHRRILTNRMFGQYVSQWQHDRTVPREARRKALGLVLLSFSLSIALVDGSGLRVMLVAIGLGLVCFLAWLPTTSEGPESTAGRQ